MVTRRRVIREAHREHPIRIVSPSDFKSEPGDVIAPAEVVRDPKFTPYCLDPENETVLFVESDDPVAIDRAPFYYQAQFDHAVGLVSMPFETFHRVAEDIAEPPKGLIFIHSVGRCGSTLLSKALAAVESVHSLSEPDDLTQMVNFRNAGALSDEEACRLMRSSAKWRGKPRAGPAAEFVAIKTRSEVLVLADLIGPAFPRAKHLFLYRDGVSWSGSILRGWPQERDVCDGDLNRKMAESWSQTVPLVGEYLRQGTPMNALQIRVLGWVACMEAYLTLVGMNLSLGAVRFEDLISQPIPTLARLFEFIGIEDADWDEIEAVLGRDSQAGTIFDREERRKRGRALTESLVQDVRDIIATRPALSRPDIVLPGTLYPPPPLRAS